MKTKVEGKAECKQYFLNITEVIGKRLSPPKLRQYIDLMKLFRSRLIEGDELIKFLINLFEEDECLSQIFNQLMEEEIRELKKNEATRERKRKRSKSNYSDEIEESEIREEHCQSREIGREEIDKPIKKRSEYRSFV